jgi:hypothetical protein
MGLDIRIPMGLMFAILGAIITVFGLVSNTEIYRRHSLGININLGWGLVMLAFAAVMLLLAYRASKTKAAKKTDTSGAGDAT